jgi:hypothetical protein
MRTSEEREILFAGFCLPEVLYKWSLILRVLYLTHMDKEYDQVLGLLKDYLNGKMDFKSLIKKLKEIEAAYEQQFQQTLKEEEREEFPPITLQLDELSSEEPH